MGHGKRTFFHTGDGERSGGEHAPRPLLCCAAWRATAWCSPCGEFSSTGGRKPRAWSACPGARYVVGADITLRHVSLVAVDLSGQVTRTQTRTLAFTRTPAYFRALAAFISELCAELPRQSVLGVGLSIPGIIGSGRTSSCAPTRFPFRDCGRMNSNNISLPCRMINDANAGCLAEAWADVSLRDAVYLSLSNSVGSAVVIGRRLYLGHNCAAARWGTPRWFPAGGRATAAKAAVWTPTAAPACCTATPAAA